MADVEDKAELTLGVGASGEVWGGSGVHVALDCEGAMNSGQEAVL